MTEFNPPPQDQLTRLADVLDGAVALLRDAAYSPPLSQGDMPPAPSLLQQCLDLCSQHQARSPEPIRSLHHMACSGGTLISKCIAALPNVQLLSEVDPLSLMQISERKHNFAPTDMVKLLQMSTRGARQEVLVDIFREEMRLVYRDAVSHGQHLVVRDHAHSHFCTKVAIDDRPSLRQLLPPDVAVLSLLNVRHPLDSYASLCRQSWVHFEPKSFDEYCRRYMLFLDHYAGVPIVQYEDFVADPESTMQHICGLLDLRYESHFQHLFGVFELSGDSGRTGRHIAPRPPLASAESIRLESGDSEHYASLISRLGYEDRRG